LGAADARRAAPREDPSPDQKARPSREFMMVGSGHSEVPQTCPGSRKHLAEANTGAAHVWRLRTLAPLRHPWALPWSTSLRTHWS